MKRACCLALIMTSASGLLAALSEPDNIVYGRIVIEGAAVTASDVDVTVEARGYAGQLYDAYTMGTEPAAGDFYRLVVPVEAFAPLAGTNACALGGSVRLTVKRNGTDVRYYDLTVTERGVVARIDLGGVDDDGDGVPDVWELEHFDDLATVTATSDFDNDGMTDMQEMIAGSDPRNPLSLFVVDDINMTGLEWCRVVWKSAEGRTYAVEVSTNSPAGPWESVVDGVMATPPSNTYYIQAEQEKLYIRINARAPMTTP